MKGLCQLIIYGWVADSGRFAGPDHLDVLLDAAFPSPAGDLHDRFRRGPLTARILGNLRQLLYEARHDSAGNGRA